ncbi:MAG TPA: hypothetical protein VGP96_09495 [Candidatus Dormibacteraeota bacterium]|jgi:hypothetical protein|nr:hypothetical protein [Candidatus Dormibacteraeota bacterium]
MSDEVDVFSFGPFTHAAGLGLAYHFHNPALNVTSPGSGLWCLIAPQLVGNNAIGTNVGMSNESVQIDSNGNQVTRVSVTNSSVGTAQFLLNVMSTPSQF